MLVPHAPTSRLGVASASFTPTQPISTEPQATVLQLACHGTMDLAQNLAALEPKSDDAMSATAAAPPAPSKVALAFLARVQRNAQREEGGSGITTPSRNVARSKIGYVKSTAARLEPGLRGPNLVPDEAGSNEVASTASTYFNALESPEKVQSAGKTTDSQVQARAFPADAPGPARMQLLIHEHEGDAEDGTDGEESLDIRSAKRRKVDSALGKAPSGTFVAADVPAVSRLGTKNVDVAPTVPGSYVLASPPHRNEEATSTTEEAQDNDEGQLSPI